MSPFPRRPCWSNSRAHRRERALEKFMEFDRQNDIASERKRRREQAASTLAELAETWELRAAVRRFYLEGGRI